MVSVGKNSKLLTENLLEVNALTKIYKDTLGSSKKFTAVNNVSFSLPNNDPRIVTIAGESGSGKTTLALLLLGFLYPTSGNIFYKGVNLGSKEWPRFRREVQAIFQNPYEAFNPVYKIDHALVLPIKNFRLARSKTIAREIISQSLEAVGLNPGQILGKYPHQMSGGQLQRVMIARILMVKPCLIIADEPVSMIDASLRAVILKDLVQIKKDNGISIIYITHDLSTALQISDEIMIFYRGSVVEKGSAEEVILNPKHPYTKLLVSSVPRPDPSIKWENFVPSAMADSVSTTLPNSCSFFENCPERMKECKETSPTFFKIKNNHHSACFLHK
jgi:peptide/nickel transport system ATP-binding protein